MAAYPGYSEPTTVYPEPSTVVYAQPMIVTNTVVSFRESPVLCSCPHCHARITTSTTYEIGTFAWILCLVLAFIGLWIGCCLIPFCVDGCKDVVHTCPNCRKTVGTYRRM